ncbi:MAG TPA: hypothetical protein VG035_04225, partial [Actinomycetota bacterium]|nr:hypothetical protein [Actinomycetota bacterium]
AEDGGAQPPTPSPGGDESVEGLLRQADAEYRAAQQALADGDLAEYQRRIDNMGRLIQQALSTEGDGTPTPTTTTNP